MYHLGLVVGRHLKDAAADESAEVGVRGRRREVEGVRQLLDGHRILVSEIYVQLGEL